MKEEITQSIATEVRLTPLSLSIKPLSIQASGESSYEHDMQLNTGVDGSIFANTISSTTFNGTQTYSWDGSPNDSDNDSDADPYG
tara:strand:+ start:143 stop:397 length:255 start_codon:yes stop_codon:yes gene_type:complete